MQKLRTYNSSDIFVQTFSEIADTVDAAAKMGIKVRWIDRVLGEIGAQKGHDTLL